MTKKVTKEVTNKINEKELKQLIEFRTVNIENLTKLGNIDYQILLLEEQKWEIKSQISETEENYRKALAEIKETHGNVNIDLETGKITEVKEEIKAATK